MKRVHTTRVIVLLIIGVLIWQYVEKRNDLQCYVMQLARQATSSYFQSRICQRKMKFVISVFNDTRRRLSMEGMWRAIAGQNLSTRSSWVATAAQQVVTYLTEPPGRLSPDFSCGGSIEWRIWYDPDVTVHRSYSGTDIKPMRRVTTALQNIPLEELQHYQVLADLTFHKGSWNDGIGAWSAGSRSAGTVSAREWLSGKIVPDYWSGWYKSYLKHIPELQNADDE